MAELIVFRKAGEMLHLKENYNVRRNCSNRIVSQSRVKQYLKYSIAVLKLNSIRNTLMITKFMFSLCL